jgi:GT2 family glycosyltransferase
MCDPFSLVKVQTSRSPGSHAHACPPASSLRTLELGFVAQRLSTEPVGGFDESFAYGSDVDFSWRLTDAGYRIRCVPEAIIRHDYGTPRRQCRRSYEYGKARTHLYSKHRSRRQHILHNDPLVVVYPLFLLGLPLTPIFPPYPLLLLIPARRNRSRGAVRVLTAYYLWYGTDVPAELAGQ